MTQLIGAIVNFLHFLLMLAATAVTAVAYLSLFVGMYLYLVAGEEICIDSMSWNEHFFENTMAWLLFVTTLIVGPIISGKLVSKILYEILFK